MQHNLNLPSNMFVTPRSIAFLSALLVAVSTALFLTIIKELPVYAFWLAGAISFVSSFFIFYLVLEFTIFRRINKLYIMMDKIRKKDIKKSLKSYKPNNNTLLAAPVGMISEQIQDFAYAKEQEIDRLRQLEEQRREFFADISHEPKHLFLRLKVI